MEREHRLCIAWDAEHGDSYLAEIVDDEAHGHDPKPHPIVKILQIISYPAQRAIAHPETAHETPPLPEGCFCRLQILAEAPSVAGIGINYKKALREAREKAMDEARSEREKEIIRRHMAGDIRGKRAVVTYRAWEIQGMPARRGNEEEHAKPNYQGEHLHQR